MRLDLWESGRQEIAAKEFLSRKDIEELILPADITSIGNWAFAHMKNLEYITFPRKEIHLGKDIFLGCDGLKQVRLKGEENDFLSDAGCMLAGLLPREGTLSLLMPKEIGSGEWFFRADEFLTEFLEEEDESGFQPMWFGGEEDYDDNETNVALYREKRRTEKLALAITRLLHDAGLTAEHRKQLYLFLQNTLAGTEEAPWQFLAARYGQQSQVFRIVAQAGCVAEKNEQMVLRVMENGSPEGRAFLLQWCAEHLRTTGGWIENLSL